MALSRRQQQSLNMFGSDLKKFSNTVGVSLDKVVKKVSFELHKKVIVKTPVDTGRARSSWNINAGRVDPSVQPEGRRGRSGATGIALRKQTNFDLPSPYSRVYITNNLPYITVLEDGSSTQAPRGMVRISIIEIRAGLAKAIIEATR